MVFGKNIKEEMLLDKKGFYTVSFVLKNCSKKKKP
jgi:hypothetical protein